LLLDEVFEQKNEVAKAVESELEKVSLADSIMSCALCLAGKCFAEEGDVRDFGVMYIQFQILTRAF
jgi:hypothetical protein